MGIQAGSRLIQQQQLAGIKERTSYCHALRLTNGQTSGLIANGRIHALW